MWWWWYYQSIGQFGGCGYQVSSVECQVAKARANWRGIKSGGGGVCRRREGQEESGCFIWASLVCKFRRRKHTQISTSWPRPGQAAAPRMCQRRKDAKTQRRLFPAGDLRAQIEAPCQTKPQFPSSRSMTDRGRGSATWMALACVMAALSTRPAADANGILPKRNRQNAIDAHARHCRGGVRPPSESSLWCRAAGSADRPCTQRPCSLRRYLLPGGR